MSTFRCVRVSKFRHAYGQMSRREQCYEGMRITTSAHDSQICAVNPKFIAAILEVAGGGSFQVVPLKWVGKVDYHVGRVSGHGGPVNDIKWNPFNDNVIASCSDDCTIKLWHIPDEGIKNTSTSWLCQLCCHSRKVTYIEWHPTAENVLASAGLDYKVLVWNVSSGDCLTEIECHEDVIYSLTFNLSGSLLATTCKDKLLRVIDARTGQVLQEAYCHEGGKASKVVFLNSKKRILTTGFSRTSHRQFAVWDQDNLSEPLVVQEVDSSAGVLFPFFDDDLGIVYLAGKGDGNIRFYEILSDAPYVQYLSEFQSRFPQRGLGVMPKRALNPAMCEVYRFYKVHTTQPLVEPVSFIVPRKSEAFQADLYPPTPGATPALSAEEWLCGIDKDPIRVSMKNAFGSATNKPVTLKLSGQRPMLITSDRNNERKFQFLSQVTKPDYREVTQREDYPDLLKQEQLKSKLHERAAHKHSRTPVSAGSSADSEGERSRYFPTITDNTQRGSASLGEEECSELEEEVRPTSPGRVEGRSGSSSAQLPPRSPRTPITLSAVTTRSSGLVGHSPSKMRRISQSPAPSPFRELQMDDVVSNASDGMVLNGVSAGSDRGRSAIHGSVEGALSIASTNASSSVVDAVSLPPRTSLRSPAPIRAAPSEHSHLHSHLPKIHRPQPVHMTVGGGSMLPAADAPKRTTRPGVITSGPLVAREQTAHIKPFRISHSQPPTPRENAVSPAGSAAGKKDSEIQLLYTQQCRRVRELMDETETKDKRMAQMEHDVLELRKEIEQLRCDAALHKDEVESLRYEISWKDSRIGYLEKELARSSQS